VWKPEIFCVTVSVVVVVDVVVVVVVVVDVVVVVVDVVVVVVEVVVVVDNVDVSEWMWTNSPCEMKADGFGGRQEKEKFFSFA
jgi:hypothetical protein